MSERDRGRHSLQTPPRGGRKDTLPFRDPPSTATREGLIGLGPFPYNQLGARPRKAAQAQPSTSQSSAGGDQSVHGPHGALAQLGSQWFTSNQPKHDRSGAAGAGVTPSAFAAAQQLSLWPPGAGQGNSSRPPRVPTRRIQRSVGSTSNLRRPQDPELQQRASAARVEDLTSHANALSTAAQGRDLLPDRLSAKREGEAPFSETAMLGLTRSAREASVAAAPPHGGRVAQIGPGLAWGKRKSRHADRDLGSQPLTKSSLKTKEAPQNSEEGDPGIRPAPSGAAAAHSNGRTGLTFGRDPLLDAFESAGPSSSRRSGQPTGAPPTISTGHARQQDAARGSDAWPGSTGGAMTGAGTADAGTSEWLALDVTLRAEASDSRLPGKQKTRWKEEIRSKVFNYLAQGMRVADISRKTGVPARTIQLWRRRLDST